MILERIRNTVKPGTEIARPHSTKTFTVVRWSKVHGEPAMVYRSPMKPGTRMFLEKRIAASMFTRCFEELARSGEITKPWFEQSFPDLKTGQNSHFTALGGVLELLGEARYVRPGVYKRQRSIAPEARSGHSMYAGDE